MANPSRHIAPHIAPHIPPLALALLAANTSVPAAEPPRDYPVKPVPFPAVRLTDDFWAPRIELNRAVTIPFAFEKCEETKRIQHFVRAATVLRGETLEDKSPPGYPFDDSDVYKVIEGAAYTLSVKRDLQLEGYLDALITKIAAAQEPDGYLYTTRTINPASPHPWAGTKRWELEKVDSHELYNLGHLFEAAVAHYQATGKRSLLDVALKAADLLDRTFGPGKASTWPGHQVTEMGLVKLYRVTGEARYLALAKFLLDQRGPDGTPGSGRTYNQSHTKVVDQTEAAGHAVRATYLYSGMADVAALTGDTAYVSAIDRIWEDVSLRKLYLTGGIGARGSGEAFGANYELPNLTAYGETCAAVGNDFWNHRLFLLHGEARYVDVMERTLYNGLLSGVSLDGKLFFYDNPLESNGQHERKPWFGVACCPANAARLLASLPGYVYAQRKGSLYVNLFVRNRAEIAMEGGGKIVVAQETRYPWEGRVRITVEPERTQAFALHVRIPGWAHNEPAPGRLYRFLDTSDEAATLRVNGVGIPVSLDKGYAVLQRTWKSGDVVELDLPMPIRRVAARDEVVADRGRAALQRGPLVYAAEWPDNPGGHVRNLFLSETTPLRADWQPDLLKGIVTIDGRATVLTRDAQGKVVSTEQAFRAIPYYAWAHRGKGEMLVWIPTAEGSARPQPFPTLASTSTITVSGGRNPGAIHDLAEPQSSADQSETAFHWWPKRGTTEWVEYTFESPSPISQAAVYWFDDTGDGEVRLPRSWRLLYKDVDTFRPVDDAKGYDVDKDRYNVVTFRPVTTTALRLEVTLQPEHSAGILEWTVGGTKDR